jgi:hypothetical protein
VQALGLRQITNSDRRRCYRLAARCVNAGVGGGSLGAWARGGCCTPRLPPCPPLRWTGEYEAGTILRIGESRLQSRQGDGFGCAQIKEPPARTRDRRLFVRKPVVVPPAKLRPYGYQKMKPRGTEATNASGGKERAPALGLGGVGRGSPVPPDGRGTGNTKTGPD